MNHGSWVSPLKQLPIQPTLELVGRGVIAWVTTAVTMTGGYPVVPALLQAKSRNQSMLARLSSVDLIREWLSGLACAVMRPAGFFHLPGSQLSGKRPILLVHGYVMGRSCFSVLATRLARAGFGPIIGFEYWSLGSIADAATRLAQTVARVRRQTGAQHVDLIGHSMGGLVCRYYASIKGGADSIGKLITLATPHFGTEHSLLGVGRARRELKVGSPLLARMAQAPIPPSIDLTVVSSTCDVLAGEQRHAHLDGAESVRIDRVNHLEMLLDRNIAEIIIARLNRPLGEQPAHSMSDY